MAQTHVKTSRPQTPGAQGWGRMIRGTCTTYPTVFHPFSIFRSGPSSESMPQAEVLGLKGQGGPSFSTLHKGNPGRGP